MVKIMSDGEYIAVAKSCFWTYAKTMSQCPHEYIVRGKTADDETYFSMFQTIEERGKWREWCGTKYQYLHPGDGFYYWKMTDIIEESIIINRAKEED